MQAREMLPELKQRIQQLLDEIVHLESQVGVHRDHGRQRNITILLYESIQQYWQMSIRIDVQVGVYKADYKRIWEQVLEMHPMYKLQLRLQELIKQVRQISKLQNYQREREARFRQTSDSTNQRIFWWAIAQIEILVITGFWQMRHLKTFIEAKKLV